MKIHKNPTHPFNSKIPALPRSLNHLADGKNFYCSKAAVVGVSCQGTWDLLGRGCVCKGNSLLTLKQSKWECKKQGDYHIVKIPKKELDKLGSFENSERGAHIYTAGKMLIVSNKMLHSWASTPHHLITEVMQESGNLKVKWGKGDRMHIYYKDKHLGEVWKFNRLRTHWKINKTQNNWRAYFKFEVLSSPKMKGKEWKGK